MRVFLLILGVFESFTQGEFLKYIAKRTDKLRHYEIFFAITGFYCQQWCNPGINPESDTMTPNTSVVENRRAIFLARYCL